MSDDEWLFESIIQFLRSPLWTNPVQTFIDENCILFDDSEENPFALTTVHNNFRNLVDSILKEQLDDMGISEEQFIKACTNGKSKELNLLVSEYILALDDFVTFKKMMDKRNVELELEALRTLKETGDIPQKDQGNLESEELELLKLAIAASIQDDEIYAKQLEMEDAQLEHALAMSLLLEQERLRKAESEAEELKKVDQQKAEEVVRKAKKEHDINVHDLQKTFETEKTIQESLRKDPKAQKEQLCASMEKLSTSTQPTLAAVRVHRLSPFITKPALPSIPHSTSSPSAQPKSSAVADALPVKQLPQGPTQEEIEQRKQAMKAAREKLLAAKKSERQKEMETWEKKQQENSPATTVKANAPKPTGELDEKQREMRIALGRRFKEDLLEEARSKAQ